MTLEHQKMLKKLSLKDFASASATKKGNKKTKVLLA